MSNADHVTVERADAVGRVVVDRPDAHNALTRAAAGDLRDAVLDLAEDDDVRAVVLTGTGDAFCTGADLTALSGDATDGRRLRHVATRLHAAVRGLLAAPKPVVAAVNGVAAGGGLGPALAADVVVAAESARFEFAYPRVGLSGDGCSTFLLPRLLGLRRAREFALLDEPMPAAEAVEAGLATEAVPDGEFDDRVATLAAELAGGPTRAYARTKRLLLRSYGRTASAAMAAEADAIVSLARTEDYARGHEAFVGGDEPEFVGE